MDISKDLKEISENPDIVENFIDSIANQEKELKIKSHIFKAIAIANELEQLVEKNIFQKYELDELCIHLLIGAGCILDFVLYDKDENQKKEIYDSNGNYIEPFQNLKKSMTRFGGFRVNTIDEKFKEKEYATFKLQKGIGDKVLDILLSKELKAIISYANLKNELPNNETINKKIKL